MPTPPDASQIDAFIARWTPAEQAERTNAQAFLIELCDLLGLPRPQPAQGGSGPYRFERSVVHRDDEARDTTRRIDLYKQGCFILEAKQGARARPHADLLAAPAGIASRQAVRHSPGWARHMLRAKGQAEGYVRDLPPEEPSPPFLIVCDVGFCFDLYADFSGTGRHYAQFPDRDGFRLYLDDLRHPGAREKLIAIWTDPRTLDPARRRTEVTREIAAYLARLAQSLERRHPAETVAFFLMRCLFSMFAQSVGLLPSPATFTDLLADCAENLAAFPAMAGALWQAMDTGGFFYGAKSNLRRFNGGLFRTAGAIAVTIDELNLLIMAARRDWSNVEPAIFGTLLENALSARERGELGAHFTPRAFVERLVLPTVMEPLRAEWDGYKAASDDRLKEGDGQGAAVLLRQFHARLCAVRVLDPACGTGNFLYVTMELMKRLEGEVLDALANLGETQETSEILAGGVGPRQFLGLEKNPRAVQVADLVLWIGALQWHFRTHGSSMPLEPILHDYGNIRHADSLLTADREELLRDAGGKPVTRWDGRTFKKHPVTGADVPDEAARTEVVRLIKPRMTEWPAADFIVGNPPFIAGKDMRAELGDGYAQALWATYENVPQSADIALFFWWRAAQLLIRSKPALQRFGFITSNSIRQTFCRRVLADSMAGRRKLRLVFAIPDHPWSDGQGSAAVRIAMTVAERATRGTPELGLLERVKAEREGTDGVPEVEIFSVAARINPDLSGGADPDQALPLRANEKISSPGVKLHGAGFIVTPAQAAALGLGRVPGLERHIRPYLNGRDLTQRSRGVMVADCFGLGELALRQKYPALFQHLLLRVKPERDQNARATYRDNWWIFGEPRSEWRAASAGLPRYIATVETAKHRPFCFLSANVIPDNMLVCIATDDAFHLGVLSSRIHVAWALAAGGRLGVGNDPRYNKTRCFDPFPFPDTTPAQRKTIAAIAEELDALRRTRLDTDPSLTMTGLYNVLEKLRAGSTLTAAERDIHEAGQVSILLRLHSDLDAAVAKSYGWPNTLSAPQIVENVVGLNLERQAEEAEGRVRWLRPAYQAPAEQARPATQTAIPMEAPEDATLPVWPAREPERFVALRAALAAAPANPKTLAQRFQRASPAKITTMLQTLVALGQARQSPDGRFQL